MPQMMPMNWIFIWQLTNISTALFLDSLYSLESLSSFRISQSKITTTTNYWKWS